MVGKTGRRRRVTSGTQAAAMSANQASSWRERTTGVKNGGRAAGGGASGRRATISGISAWTMNPTPPPPRRAGADGDNELFVMLDQLPIDANGRRPEYQAC